MASAPHPSPELAIRPVAARDKPAPYDAGKLTSVPGKGGAVVWMPCDEDIGGELPAPGSVSKLWKEDAAMRDNVVTELRDEMTATLRSFRTVILDTMQQSRTDIDSLKSWRTCVEDNIDSAVSLKVALSVRMDELEKLNHQGRLDVHEQHMLTEDRVAQLAQNLASIAQTTWDIRNEQGSQIKELQSQQASLDTSVKNLEAMCLRGLEAVDGDVHKQGVDGDVLKLVQDDISALQRQRREMSASLAAKFNDLQELRDSQFCLKQCMTTLEALGKRTIAEQDHHIRAVFEEVQKDLDEVRGQQRELAESVETLEREGILESPERKKPDQETSEELEKQSLKFGQEVKSLQDALAKEIARVCSLQDDFRKDMEHQQRTDLSSVQRQIASDMDLMRAKWQNEMELLRCMCSRASESIEALWRSKGNSHVSSTTRVSPDLRHSVNSAPHAATTDFAGRLPTVTTGMILAPACNEDCTEEVSP